MRNCIGIMGVLSVQSTYLVQSEFLYRASAGALFLDFFLKSSRLKVCLPFVRNAVGVGIFTNRIVCPEAIIQYCGQFFGLGRRRQVEY